MSALWSADSAQCPGFTYYYPDIHPTAFVSFLGAGHQGAAILVRSMINGKLYVRKRNRLEAHNGGPGTDETANAIRHPNVARLVAKTPLRTSVCAETSANPPTVDLWAHCNGGDLFDLMAKYSARNERVPELLVWQLMHQLLPTVLRLHDRDIVHSDLTPHNIFVHWSKDATGRCDLASTPPSFLIGDFGCSYRLPPNENIRITRGVSETSEAVYGDLACLAKCVGLLMHAREATGLDPAKHGPEYSRALLRVQGTLGSLPGVLHRFKVARACDGEMFARVVDPLLRDIEAGLKLEDEVDHKPDFRKLRPCPRKLARRPFMFPSREALLAWPYRPPGPWYVAEVDSEGSLVSADLLEQFCEDQVMMTRHGVEIEEAYVRKGWSRACG